MDLFLALLGDTGLMAFVAVIYGFALPNWRGPRFILLGLLCGVGAVLSMLDPTEITPGVMIDSRATLVMLSGFLGGPGSAAIAAALAAAFRYSMGGLGAEAGVVSIAISVSLGLAARYQFPRTPGVIQRRDVVLLACMAPAPLIPLFMLPTSKAIAILEQTFFPLNIVTFLGVIFLGVIMLNEQRRVKAEDEVRRLAFEDELSGLGNRRAFYLHLEQAWNRWDRYGSPFSIVLIDLDKFKVINDTFGHPAGDEVIRRLGTVMRSESRTSDITARIGGEEFVLLMQNTDSEGGALAAERIRRTVETQNLDVAGAVISFTASVGVSAPCATLTSMHEALSSADQALYDAKRGGRNRVAVHKNAAPAVSVPVAARGGEARRQRKSHVPRLGAV